MTTVAEMLERLAQARGKSQLAEIMSGYQTAFRNNQDMLRSIKNIQDITKACKSKNGVSKKLMRRR